METKVGFTSLLPGGMTQDAKAGRFRLLHAGSPEPVNGHGSGKGLGANYLMARLSTNVWKRLSLNA
jgi:hypothetical protein